MSQIKLQDLSANERKQLLKEAQELENQAKKDKKKKIDDYKAFVSDEVQETIKYLQGVSNNLSKVKKSIYNDFAVIFDLKKELFPKTSDNNTHTFSTKDGNQRITLGYRTVDNYDDTVNEGVAIVKEHISSLAGDQQTRRLVELVLKLLSKDNNGNLKPSRVMQLRQLAIKSENTSFINGVEIIENAYQPQRTKQFIKVEVRGDNNEWVSVPLGMTEA